MAQADTPKPLNFSSDARPSQRAWAPVAKIDGLGKITSPLSQARRNGRRVRSSLVTRSVTILVPTWAACFSTFHQRPLNHIGEGRIVFNVGGDGELAARLDALDQHRLQHRTGGIDRRGVTSRARADDDDLGVDWGRHGRFLLVKEM